MDYSVGGGFVIWVGHISSLFLYLDLNRLNFWESVVIDEVLGVGGSVGK